MTQSAAVVLLLVALAACARTPDGESEDTPPPPAITDRDWELTSIGDLVDPRGMQDRPVTIRFDSVGTRAAGHAGCNQFSAGYRLSGDSLWFEPAMATKMMCPDAMAVETALFVALERVTRYEATDSTLTLLDPSGPLARFRAASP